MGIKDLLKFMKPYIEPIHIKKYAGKRVGIDAYSWLHKGAYSCSMELCLNKQGEKKYQYINYFMHRINLLRHHKITPVVVFDGGSMPCKAATEEERHRRRKLNHDLAMAKLKEGDVNAASELFQRAVSITPSMAHQLIQILRLEKIEFVVAPYEADAQLAYMISLEAEKGGVVAVISEDSDLLAYGCPAVIFKMDRYGNGQEIVLGKIFDPVACTPSFRNFDKELFTGMCVLAGCDFLPSVPGIGIAKAYNLVSKYRNLDRALSVLKFEKGSQVPEDYSQSFKEAVAVFHHARVYDAELKQLKHMKSIPQKLLLSFNEELDFLGPNVPASIAKAIAEGKVDPCTMEAYPSDGTHHNPINITKPPDNLLTQEATIPSSKESCFTVISACRSRKAETTAVMEKTIGEEGKQTYSIEERKYTDDAIALQKLVFPFNSQDAEVKERVATAKEVLKVPDNNPFRKRKADQIYEDSTEITDDQVSVVTEVESSEILCVTPDSQQSVDSKPVKITNVNRGNTKKIKKNTSHESNTMRSSILNFFPRV